MHEDMVWRLLLLAFRRVMKTCVAAEVGGMLQRFTIIDVSNNVYTSVFPLIISDFIQI